MDRMYLMDIAIGTTLIFIAIFYDKIRYLRDNWTRLIADNRTKIPDIYYKAFGDN